MLEKYKIAILKGDGIGPEVVDATLLVLKSVSDTYKISVELIPGLIGGSAIDVHGVPLPEETIEICTHSDAILLGAVGGKKWETLSRDLKPEVGLLNLRHKLNLYANLRNGKIFHGLESVSPIKEKYLNKAIDIMIVRELTGGIYFGKRGSCEKNHVKYAYDTEEYDEVEISRVAKIAFSLARLRDKKLTSIDKANILESSRLWRKTVENLSKEYSDIEQNSLYADNAALQLVKKPSDFDVILTNNIFGDILSDELSAIIGSIGMLPSASLGDGSLGLYEPSHGSAPYMAGLNKANPIATVLSLALMFRYSFKLDIIAVSIENAIENVLKKGYRTYDIYTHEDEMKIGTHEMGELISNELANLKVG